MLPRWLVMWLLSGALFLAAKAATLWRAGPAARRASLPRVAGYVLLWVGMDAGEFLEPRMPRERALRREWALAAIQTALGIALIWWLVPALPAEPPWLAGWAGMAGLVFVLHFGLFHLASLAWRAAGAGARPIMDAPARSASLAEFWSRRWNRAFSVLDRDLVFRPLVPRLGARTAALAAFLVSGLVHDLVISLPAGGGYGLPSLYFAIQGLGVELERSAAGSRLGLGSAARGRLFAILVTALPAPLLFHPPFLERVILPFLGAIGAR